MEVVDQHNEITVGDLRATSRSAGRSFDCANADLSSLADATALPLTCSITSPS